MKARTRPRPTMVGAVEHMSSGQLQENKRPKEMKDVQFRGEKTDNEFQALKTKQKLLVRKPSQEGNMYTMRWPAYKNTDVEDRINGVLGPLSLFAPFPHENIKEEQPTIRMERPVTPIDEEIRCQPTVFDKLAKYIRRRISPKPDVPHLNTEDQQLLAGILMGEVVGVWPEIRKQIDDPFLSASENRELNRRIAVHIVHVCEQLFLHYLQKAQVLNSRGIFSGPANMSRLKAQLALDANKFLNILTIRRYIVADMRGKDDDESLGSDDFVYVAASKPRTAVPKMSYRGLIETSRPKSTKRKIHLHSAEHEARKITNAMPTLDTNKLMNLVAELPDRQLETPSQASEAPSRASEVESKCSGMSKADLSLQKVILKRSNSLPEIQFGETLMEELGIDSDIRRDKLHEHELEYLQRENERRLELHERKVESRSPEPGSREFVTNDLQNLMRKSRAEFKVEEDMPPLLQAITRHAKHDGKKELLEKKLKKLEEKEKKEKEQQSIPLRGPTHPQPATVGAKLPNQMEVRTSDLRVSERVCMSSITLDRYATVYNDLMSEIDPATVKVLDKNLFLGEEIREVYQEIMRTIPKAHLDLDDDVHVILAADNVNITGCMASSSLTRRRVDRVINPCFLKDNQHPPWGELSHKQWVKTPNNPPKNFQGEDVFAPISSIEDALYLTPNMDKVHEVLRNPTKMSQLVTTEGLPAFVQDKMARTYASWLQWWKSTITSDDYMKYLSTQETDYLAATFHFYDSDEEDEQDEPQGTGYPTMIGFPSRTAGLMSYKPTTARSTHSSKVTEQREKEKKLEELKTQKNDFKEGFWNVNSVLMGGLGKEPQVDDDENLSLRPPRSADTTRSNKTLQERAAARHSARQEFTQSRASKVTTLTTVSKGDTERSSLMGGEATLTPQERLERVWASLEMPDGLKLDMAIKYSCNDFYIRLQEAIDRWEKVTELILKREELLAKLEKFERVASDPNRFFVKGQKRSSVQRLREAQQRSYYYKRIDLLDMEIKHELQVIRSHFKDTITYKGRPYMDKMKWDRVEMLHWLQEERKENAIKYETMIRNVPLKPAQLDPIPTQIPAQKVT